MRKRHSLHAEVLLLYCCILLMSESLKKPTIGRDGVMDRGRQNLYKRFPPCLYRWVAGCFADKGIQDWDPKGKHHTTGLAEGRQKPLTLGAAGGEGSGSFVDPPESQLHWGSNTASRRLRHTLTLRTNCKSGFQALCTAQSQTQLLPSKFPEGVSKGVTRIRWNGCRMEYTTSEL